MTGSKVQLFSSLGLVLASTAVLAQDVPLSNWTVPPYLSSSSGGLATMTDATPPRVFIGLQPCRVADTRGNGAPIQGGIFPNGGLRTWDLTGICGIPAGADAISANFTVTGSPSAPPGAFLLAWPTGGPTPPVSILNFQAGQTVANAAIVPLGPGEQIQVNVSQSTHVIMDVNGYFSDTLNNPGNFLELRNTLNGGGTALFANSSNTNMATGVVGLVGSAFPHPTNYFAAGIRGEGTLSGVLGISQYFGVGGSAVNGAGAETAYGLLGFRPGVDYGVFGNTYSTASGAAGVYGVDGAGDPHLGINTSVGVRGAGTVGVWASSKFVGLVAERVNDAGVEVVGARLGAAPAQGNVGVSSVGDIDATGMKLFVEPHPTDPTKEIAYVSLEGPEAGTYFRGRGRTRNGAAVILVPESFRLVSDEDGLTVQITPIGRPANLAVASADLNRIEVRSTEVDVEFYYLVNGVRRAFNRHEPIRDNSHYLPERPNARMPLAYSPEQRRRLVATGIYNEDGTVNTETARRLGWDREWEARSPPGAQPAP